MATAQYTPRVTENATATGTGAFQLAGATTANRAFLDVYLTGASVYYAATGIDTTGSTPSTEWEIGIGTVTSGTPNTLSRDTVLHSSNSGLLVSFTAPNIVVQNVPETFSSPAVPYGILSNPSVIVATAADGSGGDYSAAGGTFYVFDGDTDVTTSNPSAITFSVQSYTTGLTISINASGVYTVSLDNTHSTGQAILEALYNGIAIRQTYNIQKNLTGESVTVSSDVAGFTYENGSPSPSSQTATLTATIKNLTGTTTWGPSNVAALMTISGNTASLTAANFDSLGVDQVEITATNSGITDSLVLVKLTPTATTNITGDLTNPTVTIPTDANGNGGDFSGATGTFLMWDSGTDVTGSGPAYSVASSSAALTISIDPATGVYSATALSADSGSALLQASYKGVVVQRSFVIQKNLKGQDLVLTASGYSFDYANNQIVAGQSAITLTSALTNLTGTPTFTTSPAGVTLTGTGLTRSLTAANFDAAGAKEVTVTATLSGVSDSVTIVKLTSSAITPPAVSTGLLNPGFEAGQTGWSTNGWTITDDPTNSASGSWCATITGSTNAITNDARIPIKGGNTVRVHCRFKSAAGASGTGYVGISYYDANQAFISSTFTDATHLAQWVTGPSTAYGDAAIHAYAPSNAKYATLTAYVNGCTGQWYMDDCMLIHLPINLGEVGDDTVGKRGGIHTDYIDTTNRPITLRRATGAIDVTADNLSQHSEVTQHIGGLNVPTVSSDSQVTDGTKYQRQIVAPTSRNLIPDSGYKTFGKNGMYWKYPSSFTLLPGQGIDGGNAIGLLGTGAAAGYPNDHTGQPLFLPPGNYIISAYADASQVTLGGPNFQTYGMTSGGIQINAGAYGGVSWAPGTSGRKQLSFTISAPGTWAASTAYYNSYSNSLILDTNGNLQVPTTGGGALTSGTAEPTWNTTVGGTTADNGFYWTNIGSYSNGTIPLTVIEDASNCTITSGQYLKFSNPQLEVSNSAGVATPYRENFTNDNSGTTLVDFSSSSHANKTVDHINDGTTYARTLSSVQSGGKIISLHRPTANTDISPDDTSLHSEVTDHIGGLGVATIDFGTKTTGRTADKVTYTGTGAPSVDSLQPAEAGADVTGSHTSADTSAVSGTAAATVSQGAVRANATIDSGNIVVTTGMDFSRAYTNKHGGNLPRSATDTTTLDRAFAKATAGAADDATAINYSAGGTVDSLKPAQAGADVTVKNKSIIQSQDWVSPIANPMNYWALLTGTLGNSSVSSTTVGPFGAYPPCLQVRGDGATAPGWYSEWKGTWTGVDPNRGYMVACWVQAVSATTAHGIYVGLDTAIEDFTGTQQTNYYFCVNQGTSGLLTAGGWYLAVTYIHPYGTTTDSGQAGLYDPLTGLKIASAAEVRHQSTATNHYLRFGFNSTTTTYATTDGANFAQPLVYLMDGNQPSIQLLLKAAQNSAYVNSIANHGTKEITDDAGLGNTANWGSISSIPTTIVGHNLNGVVQPALPSASAGGYLANDGSGNLSWATPLAGELDGRGDYTGSTSYSTTETQIGNIIGFTAPPSGTTVMAVATGHVNLTTGSTTEFTLYSSTNGGTSWTVEQHNYAYNPSAGNTPYALSTAFTAPGGTDVLIKVTATIVGGTATTATAWQQGFIGWLIPSGSTYLVGPALTATATGGTGSTTVTYPTTSGTCTTAFNITASGGTAPYSYSAAIVTQPSGGGATLVNATTSSPEVQLTKTATQAGAQYTTVVNSTVTDSAGTPAVVTSNNVNVVQTFYLQYAAISASMSTTGGTCSTTGTSCTATGSATESPSGGNGSYTYAWSVTSGGATITSGASAATVNLSDNQNTGTTDVCGVQCLVNDTNNNNGNGAVTDTGSVTFNFIKIS